MQFPYYYTPVAGNNSPAERDAMFAKIRNADTPGNLASYNGVLALAPRPNLLDNAYFVGGGTGYGVFPVNQRYPQTQFSAAGNIFDRWKLVSGTATLTAAGLVLNGTITQTISPAPDGVLTCSALTTAGLVTPTYSNGVFTLTGTGQTFIAAKLERGSIQTLAHQESGALVLNSIPRYDEELRRCQAYLTALFDATHHAYAAVGVGVAENATTCNVIVYSPAFMRSGNLTVSISGSFALYGGSSWSPIVVTGIAAGANATNGSGNITRIQFKTAGGLTPGASYVLFSANDTTANIYISKEP